MPGRWPLVSQPPVHWGIDHRQSAFFPRRFVFKTLHRKVCTPACRGWVQNMLCWKTNAREVITAGKEPLEWEAELSGECGSLSLGCFHIWNKSKLSQKLGERSTPGPWAAASQVRQPGHP